MKTDTRPAAAVALIETVSALDGPKILVVWNKRYGRWAMPGGRIEEGETPIDALRRELTEETGLVLREALQVYEGAHGEIVQSTRGSYVYVFQAFVSGSPREIEPGCPVTWFTRDEFLQWGLAPNFYRKMFEALR